MKPNFSQVVSRVFHGILALPASILLVVLAVNLVYTCENLYVFLAELAVSILITWPFSRYIQEGRGLKFSITRVTVALISFVSIGGFLIIGNLNEIIESSPRSSLMTSMSDLRPQAELHFNNNQFSYEGVCLNESVNELKEAVESQQIVITQKCVGPLTKLIKPDFMAKSYFNCNDSSESYAAEAYLPITQEGTEFWCVDSTGFSGPKEESIGTALSCE